ncbi:MAG TPA: NTP transferase domain-containing protein [Syntrophales bacterium]|jgi:UDP-N-acetylglucosamine diphosphorylase/glucosamine-1-phosphate N-acetyltransferase|nr:NTP transferase domain-containing protein [Syntrophales bacterium]HOU77972.1 NTP transferase domain-containing protein [Syntrophales bacterium]HPC32913.1 NTP transferase domain-containing protein [Syntrophales bacterium]HQG34170.1 NTP transferase domain-containing protein [Syntrophales bacterium]HQI36170.1 NTP transferase domain-containing protein [Syntrophales bacterium]
MHFHDEDKDIGVLILAAGKGTRMKSELAKVLHTIGGRPMLTFSIELARSVGAKRIVAVIGHQAERVRELCPAPGLVFVEQQPQLGTGHAVLQARKAFAGFTGLVLILCGDVPLLKATTVKALIAQHQTTGAAVTVMTVILDDPGNYGRVVKNEAGEVMKIVEAKDATSAEREIREINTGIYCADSGFLFQAVSRIDNNNAQREYYLTDIMEIARRDGMRTAAFVAAEATEVMGINTPEELAYARRVVTGESGEGR